MIYYFIVFDGSVKQLMNDDCITIKNINKTVIIENQIKGTLLKLFIVSDNKTMGINMVNINYNI